MNITYHRNGDYLLPDLTLGGQPAAPLTKYGRMRMRFLQEHKPDLYSHLILSGKLYWHLVETQEAAQARIDLIVAEILGLGRSPERGNGYHSHSSILVWRSP